MTHNFTRTCYKQNKAGHKERETYRQTDRQTDRERDRQTDRQKERKTGRQTYRDTETGRWTAAFERSRLVAYRISHQKTGLPGSICSVYQGTEQHVTAEENSRTSIIRKPCMF